MTLNDCSDYGGDSTETLTYLHLLIRKTSPFSSTFNIKTARLVRQELFAGLTVTATLAAMLADPDSTPLGLANTLKRVAYLCFGCLREPVGSGPLTAEEKETQKGRKYIGCFVPFSHTSPCCCASTKWAWLRPQRHTSRVPSHERGVEIPNFVRFRILAMVLLTIKCQFITSKVR